MPEATSGGSITNTLVSHSLLELQLVGGLSTDGEAALTRPLLCLVSCTFVLWHPQPPACSFVAAEMAAKLLTLHWQLIFQIRSNVQTVDVAVVTPVSPEWVVIEQVGRAVV